MYRRINSCLSLLAVLSVLFTGCASAAQPPKTDGTVSVRVGYLLADLHHIGYLVASDPEAGGGVSFYEQNGVIVQDALGAPYANGGVVMDHFASGDVDIAFLGAPPAITKHLNAGVNTEIVAQVNTIGSALVVGPDIQKPEDLLGKTVAVPGHAAIQFFLLLNFAQQHSLDIGQITVVDMPPPDMRVKLESGEISGFLAWEPWPSDAIVAGAGKVMATSTDIWPNHLDCVLAVDRTFAEENPEAVRQFLNAHIAATAWMQDALADPDLKEYKHLVDLAETFTQRDAVVVEEAFNNIAYQSALDTDFLDSIRTYTSKLIEFGLIPQAKLSERGYTDPNDFVSKYVNVTFIEGLGTP